MKRIKKRIGFKMGGMGIVVYRLIKQDFE